MWQASKLSWMEVPVNGTGEIQMKRLSIFCILVLLFATLFACSVSPTQPAATTPAGQVATPLPTATTGLAETPLPEPTYTALPAAETPSSGRISLDLLKNFTYWVEDFNTQATLKDGVFSNDRIRGQLIEPAAFGDLNSDGQVDAAVILAINSGGSGTFFNLIVVLDQNGTPVQAGSSYIGDRQLIKNLEIDNGRIILDYLTQGPGNPLCCPNEHRLRSYLLENGVLLLASEQILGSPEAQATPLPNAILIDQPVTGNQLTTPLQVRGRVSQVPPEKKLAYSVTDLNATLLTQGEVSLEGEPGRPGAFTFELTLGAVPPGLIQVEVVDSANGILRGRSIVVLVAP